jgi:cyanophycin synthetase
MDILRVKVLRGPNVWSRRTCIEAIVDIGDLAERPSHTIPGLYDRLTAWLPGLVEHRCGVGERGGFLMRLRDGTYAAHILEHVTIELENLAGTPVGFGKARETSRPGVYKVAFRYREEHVGRACLEAGRELLLAAIHDRPFDVAGTVERLKDLAERKCIGPSTQSIVDAAEARDIPTIRLNDGSLVQLGQGSRHRRIWTAETDATSAVAESISRDKDLTKQLLRDAGVPVPEGRLTSSPEDAWAAAQEIGAAVAVKPLDGNHGRGVFLGLTDREHVEAAWPLSRAQGSGVIVERCVSGDEHRLLVVGDRMVAASRGESAWVTADGRSTVRQLVDAQINTDPRRGTTEDFPLGFIDYDAVVMADLARQGFDPDSVPPDGKRVMIQRNGNVLNDVTDLVHPRVAEDVVLAARAVGLDIAGIDVVADDISRPLEEQRGAVVEVNAGPGLLMHINPSSGKPRPVGQAIVDMLFAAGENGRIPVACVTGTAGTTATARLLARLLAAPGRRVGLACREGIEVGDRVLDRRDRADRLGARQLVLNPDVEAAVVEASPGGILDEGLGFDRCAVAVVMEVGAPVSLGREYVETPEHMYEILRCPVDVVRHDGTAVLNADDPAVADMARLSAGRVAFFARSAANPVLAAAREHGGRVAFVREGLAVLAHGAVEIPIGPAGDGCVVLAAALAARALDVPDAVLRHVLAGTWDRPAS